MVMIMMVTMTTMVQLASPRPIPACPIHAHLPCMHALVAPLPAPPTACSLVPASQLTTFTGNRPGAGTDAHVFVDIEGASGAISGPLQLRCATHSSGASSGCDTASSGHEGCAAGGGGSDVGGGSAVGGPFAAGAASSFELRLLDLQEPVKLTVWHDGQGTSPGWHLDRIELQHKGSGPVGDQLLSVF